MKVFKFYKDRHLKAHKHKQKESKASLLCFSFCNIGHNLRFRQIKQYKLNLYDNLKNMLGLALGSSSRFLLSFFPL